MTNREWLESLSDEELAEKLHNVSICDVNNGYCLNCIFNKVNCGKCESILEWLHAEHKENE